MPPQNEGNRSFAQGSCLSLIFGVGSRLDPNIIPGAAHLLEHLIVRRLQSLVPDGGRSGIARLTARTYPRHTEVTILAAQTQVERVASVLRDGIVIDSTVEARLEEISSIRQEIETYAQGSLGLHLAAEAVRTRLDNPDLSDAEALGFGDPVALLNTDCGQIEELLMIAGTDYQVMVSASTSSRAATLASVRPPVRSANSRDVPAALRCNALNSEGLREAGLSAISVSFEFDDPPNSAVCETIGLLCYALGDELKNDAELRKASRGPAPITFVGPYGHLRSGDHLDLIFASTAPQDAIASALDRVVLKLELNNDMERYQDNFRFEQSIGAPTAFSAFATEALAAFRNYRISVPGEPDMDAFFPAVSPKETVTNIRKALANISV